MTKREFLDKLKAALGNDLSGAVIQENVDYYNEYISEAVSSGRSEADVIAELGDPWAIAKTIVDSMGAGNGRESSSYETSRGTYDQESRYGQNGYGQQKDGGKVRVFGIDAWWKKLLLVLGIIGVVVIIVAVIGGVISLLAPLVLPILILVFVFRMLGKRR